MDMKKRFTAVILALLMSISALPVEGWPMK